MDPRARMEHCLIPAGGLPWEPMAAHLLEGRILQRLRPNRNSPYTHLRTVPCMTQEGQYRGGNLSWRKQITPVLTHLKPQARWRLLSNIEQRVPSRPAWPSRLDMLLRRALPVEPIFIATPLHQSLTCCNKRRRDRSIEKEDRLLQAVTGSGRERSTDEFRIGEEKKTSDYCKVNCLHGISTVS
jgi:hypothetical protein